MGYGPENANLRGFYRPEAVCPMQVATAPVAVSPNRTTLWLALISVYILWGSTYLFVHFMTEQMPPLYMASMRFLTAGVLLYGYSRLAGAARPTLANWRATGIIGILLLGIANGAVTLALQYLPTGLTALLVAMLPVFILTFNWIGFSRTRPTNLALLGLGLGLGGVFFLLPPGSLRISGGASATLTGVGLSLVANVAWAVGTLLTPRLTVPASPTLSSGMQMLAAGLLLFGVALLTEPVTPFSLAQAPPKALYLVVFGSIVGFSSFSWLARNASPTLASTYAYVNPVVAMLLGALFAGEVVSTQSLIGAAIIVSGVVLITLGKTSGRTGKEENV